MSKPTCGADAAASALGLPGSTPSPSSSETPNGLTSEGSACCLAIISSKSGIQSVMSISSSSFGSSLILLTRARSCAHSTKSTAHLETLLNRGAPGQGCVQSLRSMARLGGWVAGRQAAAALAESRRRSAARKPHRPPHRRSAPPLRAWRMEDLRRPAHRNAAGSTRRRRSRRQRESSGFRGTGKPRRNARQLRALRNPQRAYAETAVRCKVSL